MLRSYQLCSIYHFLETSDSKLSDLYRRNTAFVALLLGALGENEV